MVDNQHKKIIGYRDLTQAEIDLMNEIKAVGETLAALCSRVATNGGEGRWGSIAKTHLQQGIMALVRSVAKPESF